MLVAIRSSFGEEYVAKGGSSCLETGAVSKVGLPGLPCMIGCWGRRDSYAGICKAVDEMDNEKVTELKKAAGVASACACCGHGVQISLGSCFAVQDLVTLVQQKAYEMDECDTQDFVERNTKRS